MYSRLEIEFEKVMADKFLECAAPHSHLLASPSSTPRRSLASGHNVERARNSAGREGAAGAQQKTTFLLRQ